MHQIHSRTVVVVVGLITDPVFGVADIDSTTWKMPVVRRPTNKPTGER